MNTKLSTAIQKGNDLNNKRLEDLRENIIKHRLARFLTDDYIYLMISEVIGEGKTELEIYDHHFIDNIIETNYCCEAINRIEGLTAIIDSTKLNPFNQNQIYYYLRVKWEMNTKEKSND